MSPYQYRINFLLTILKDRRFRVADAVIRHDRETGVSYATHFLIARTIPKKDEWYYDLASAEGVTVYEEVHESELKKVLGENLR